jgi:hypothetical protein
VTEHGFGKRVFIKNSAGLAPTLCAGWMLDTRLPFTRTSEKSKKPAVAPVSNGAFLTTRIFAPW